MTSEKISFLLSGFLPDHEGKLQEILCSGAFTECTVFTGISEAMLVKLGKCDEGYFLGLMVKLKDWLRQGQTDAETKTGYACFEAFSFSLEAPGSWKLEVRS